MSEKNKEVQSQKNTAVVVFALTVMLFVLMAIKESACVEPFPATISSDAGRCAAPDFCPVGEGE